ncbi:hypothetical protein Tco_0105456 [Tanacetum coccineum]
MASDDKEKGSEKKAGGSIKKTLANKRASEKQSEESSKRQKMEDDAEKEELRAHLDIISGDDVAVSVESLATKYPIVDWKTYVLSEDKMYYEIIRANGSRLFDSCGVHVLLMNTGIAIHMLVEKTYPLTQEMLSRMLSGKLYPMSSASSDVKFTSDTTGLPYACFPPSPDFILGPENLQILPVPQDEDEREPMFIQAHDPDYVPEPIYPEYIPLEDDHEFPTEEQPLPPADSPTAESPGYITE